MHFNGSSFPILNEPKKLIAIVLFLVAVALFLGQLWDFFLTKATVPQSLEASQKKEAPTKLNTSSAVFTVSMFGKYVPTLSELEIKQSTLDVELVGILFSTNPKESQILVRIKPGDERTFMLGDVLPGGAKIHEIHKKGIVVLFDGSLESLSLPQNELLFEKPPKPLIRE